MDGPRATKSDESSHCEGSIPKVVADFSLIERSVKQALALCWELTFIQENEMKTFFDSVQRFWRDDSGVTAIEYGLIAALIAVGIIAAVTTIGEEIAAAFQSIADGLPSAEG
jgi:pilus assembly protein Flp/PilA